MGRMLDALKEIEAKQPEAELSFPDDLLAETAALLDRYEKGELPAPAPAAPLREPDFPQPQTPPVNAETAAPLAETPPSMPAVLPAVLPAFLPVQPLPRDSRHVDLAINILSQIPARGTVDLLFAAPAGGGVFAAALAPLFATLAERAGGRTLLVECDFRRPVLASRFSLQPRAGLDDVLASRAEWTDAVCRTDRDCLDVVCATALNTFSAGETPEYAASNPWQSLEPLIRSDFKSILAPAGDKYRLVLLENVSFVGDELPQLTSLCHGTYLLLRAAQTTRRSARAAAAGIKQSGGCLLGCILLDE